MNGIIILSVILCGITIFCGIKSNESTTAKIGALTSGLFTILSFFIGIGIIPIAKEQPINSIGTAALINSEITNSINANTMKTENTKEPVSTASSSIPADSIDASSITTSFPTASLPVQTVNEVVVVKDGNITYDKQKDTYNFIPPRAGTYRFEITDLYAEKQVSLYIFDPGGNVVNSVSWIVNNQGITTTKLKAGQLYTISVEQAKGYSKYKLNICYQQETINANGKKVISDKIQFTNQINKYSFSPPLNGTYRFEISDLYAEKRVSIYIIDQGEGVVTSKTWIGNNDGITISKLESGQQYTVLVEQAKGLTPYKLNIGYQKETIEIKESNSVNGIIEFTNQADKYSFSPSKAGTYSFIINNLQAEKRVSLYITDQGGGTVISKTWIGNGQGIESDKLQKGQKYIILVEQAKEFTPYTLSIN